MNSAELLQDWEVIKSNLVYQKGYLRRTKRFDELFRLNQAIGNLESFVQKPAWEALR